MGHACNGTGLRNGGGIAQYLDRTHGGIRARLKLHGELKE